MKSSLSVYRNGIRMEEAMMLCNYIVNLILANLNDQVQGFSFVPKIVEMCKALACGLLKVPAQYNVLHYFN